MLRRDPWWRHVPNAISTARLLSTPVLLWAAVTHHRPLFTWLLLAALLSDILDGLIARAFNLRTALGARLDSLADVLVFGNAILGLFRFEAAVLRAHWLPLVSVVGLYILEILVALWRYGRISSFHTVLVRITAYLQGIFIMSLLFWGYSPILLVLTAGMSIIAYGEELVLIALLPDFTTDVRGVYWVLRDRRANAAS